MPQDAAASGAQSDADSTQKGEKITVGFDGNLGSDAGTTGDTPDIEKIVAARLNSKLKSLNIEDLRRKAAEFDSLQESQKTETQKLADKITALEAEKSNWETERKRDRLQTATVREAARLGFRDPADAYRLLDDGSIEFDDAGQPTNVGKLLSGLLKDKPYLASVNGSADGGQRGESPNGKADENTLIRAALLGRS